LRPHFGVHLRPPPPQPPPPPLLAEPRALDDLDPQPPSLLPLKADDPLLFSCPPQPLEAAELELEPDFWELLEAPE